jgi:predicted dehydrogenase
LEQPNIYVFSLTRGAFSVSIKVGIVGTGGIAEMHARGYHRAEDVELVACCDLLEERARKFAELHGFKRHHTDYSKMLGAEDLDGISICTPNYAHKDPTIQALKRDVSVLCEKPVGMNAKEAKAMAEASRKSKGFLTVGQHYRFDPANQALKKMVDAGDLGEIYYGRSHSTRRVGIPGWGVFHVKEKSAGGPLIDIGVHALDLTLWLMGFPGIESVTGQAYTKFGNTKEQYHTWGELDPKTYSVEDFACGMARLSNGASLLVESAWASHVEKESSTQVVLGTKGGVSAYPHRAYTVLSGNHVNIEFAELPKVEPHEEEVIRFVDCIRGEKEVVVHPEESFQVMQLIDSIYKSAETGKEIRIKEHLEIPGKQTRK